VEVRSEAVLEVQRYEPEELLTAVLTRQMVTSQSLLESRTASLPIQGLIDQEQPKHLEVLVAPGGRTNTAEIG